MSLAIAHDMVFLQHPTPTRMMPAPVAVLSLSGFPRNAAGGTNTSDSWGKGKGAFKYFSMSCRIRYRGRTVCSASDSRPGGTHTVTTGPAVPPCEVQAQHIQQVIGISCVLVNKGMDAQYSQGLVISINMKYTAKADPRVQGCFKHSQVLLMAISAPAVVPCHG
jgi:hypothetical protein